MTMNADAFLRGLADDGFAEVEHKQLLPDTCFGEHRHACDARLLVVEGELALGLNGDTRTYRAGESFEVRRDVPHTERYAAKASTRLIVGRRR